MNKHITKEVREDEWSKEVRFDLRTDNVWCSSTVHFSKQDGFGRTRKANTAEINNSATGPMSVADTELFAEMVNEAIKTAKKLEAHAL